MDRRDDPDPVSSDLVGLVSFEADQLILGDVSAPCDVDRRAAPVDHRIGPRRDIWGVHNVVVVRVRYENGSEPVHVMDAELFIHDSLVCRCASADVFKKRRAGHVRVEKDLISAVIEQ